MQHAKVETPMPPSSTPSSARPLAHLTSLQAMLLLGSLGTLNILWSDMLFPAITSIQQDLGTSATAVQQTISLYFVANAFMCLWHGVLSDAWGRRKPLLIGLVVLVLTSLLSLLATRIEHLWILRTVQGLVVGLGHILCRAVIRDLHSGEAAQKMIAHTTLLQSLGTIILPMLGGWLTWMWGWRACLRSSARWAWCCCWSMRVTCLNPCPRHDAKPYAWTACGATTALCWVHPGSCA